MLDENHFIAISSATLMHFNDQLEQAYDNGDLDELDYDEVSGILSIITAQGVTFIVNRHGPSRQILLASPISGGLHFDYCIDSNAWKLPDGRTLNAILTHDIEKTTGLKTIL